jgi:DNA-binding response OmpR family regulator
MNEHYKVLVVDDDKRQQLITISYLSEFESEFTILSAPNGKIAIKIAEAELPDLILMDWEMPEMNGINALAHLKQEEKTKNIPVIMVTALANAQDLEYALDLGAADYVKKPFDSIELIARINNTMNNHKKLQEAKSRIIQLEETIKLLRGKLDKT